MKNEQDIKLPLGKKILYLLLDIIKYPFRIAKKYETYNHGISDLISVKNEPKLVGEDDKFFREFQKKNSRLVFGFIYLPLILGSIISLSICFSNKESYIRYYKQLTYQIKEESLTKKISLYIRKAVFLVKNNPIKNEEISPLFLFYIVSIFGAKFLSYNPVFKKEDLIRRNLLALGCIDIDGNPWRIVWTPEAMLFVSFGKDPFQLAQDQKFWTTINFPPSIPKQSKKDMNKFVVQKKYELSGNMIFDISKIKENV